MFRAMNGLSIVYPSTDCGILHSTLAFESIVVTIYEPDSAVWEWTSGSTCETSVRQISGTIG